MPWMLQALRERRCVEDAHEDIIDYTRKMKWPLSEFQCPRNVHKKVLLKFDKILPGNIEQILELNKVILKLFQPHQNGTFSECFIEADLFAGL